MHEDLNIQYPQHADCHLQPESETYNCHIPLTNLTPHTLFFHLASTFGLFFKELTDVKHLAAGESITLALSFKSTNIISHTREFVVISFSPSPLSQICSLPQSQIARVHLRFSENFVDDPIIEAIVAEDVRHLLGQAHKQKMQGKYAQARIQFEEAFQLLRHSDQALFGMAECQLALRDWANCLRDIETALINCPANPRYQFLKMKALVGCYGGCKGWQGEIIEDCHKVLKNLQVQRMIYLSKEEQEELNVLINSIEQNPLLNRMRMLKKSIISNALQNYHQGHPISKWYPSRGELNQQLREVLLGDEVEENATPEEIVDPISYEIMSNPCILESGHSFDQKTLQQYFQKNGFMDPITRKNTYPQWVFPNINLRDYIREHPKLKLWRQYQYDLLHN